MNETKTETTCQVAALPAIPCLPEARKPFLRPWTCDLIQLRAVLLVLGCRLRCRHRCRHLALGDWPYSPAAASPHRLDHPAKAEPDRQTSQTC